METKVVPLSKAFSKRSKDIGMTIFVMAIQPEKALRSIRVSPSGNHIFCNLIQFANASLPIFFMVEGKSTSSSCLQFLNVPSGISVIPSESITRFKFLHFSKQ